MILYEYEKLWGKHVIVNIKIKEKDQNNKKQYMRKLEGKLESETERNILISYIDDCGLPFSEMYIPKKKVNYIYSR